jgi:hypothetical protein
MMSRSIKLCVTVFMLLSTKLLMIRGSQRIMKMCRRGINHLRLFSREGARLVGDDSPETSSFASHNPGSRS